MNINAFILMGNWLERTSTLDKIKASMGEYELEVYDESYSWEYVQQALLEHSCFDQNKLIIINGLPSVKDKDPSASRTKVLNGLKKILPMVDGNTCVVLNGITITSKKFLDAVNEKVHIKSFDITVPKRNAQGSAVKRLVAYFTSKDKTINDSDAYLAVDSINYNSKDVNLDKVFLMAKKIENLVGGRKKVTHEDIVSICSLSPDFLIWNLFKALDNQDFAEALALIDKIASRSLSFEHEIIMALSVMIWKFRQLLFVRSCLDSGLKIKDIEVSLGRLVKWNKSGQGVRRHVVPQETKKDKTPISMYTKPSINMLFNNTYGKSPISCYSQEHLLRVLPITEMCLRKIRSGCSEGEIRIVLEILCLVICNEVEYNVAKEIFKSNYCL
jgi:hypothetical protein